MLFPFARPLPGLALCAASLAVTAAGPVGAAPLDYPPTRRVEQTDRYFGQTVADPYRWLEDDNSAETAAWVQAQNALTEQQLAALPQRAAVRRLYTTLFNFEKFGVPFKEGGRYFWTRNDGLQPHSVLVTASSLTATPTVAMDPNTLSTDGTVALTGTVPSPDGRRLAYGTARAGSDWQTWRVRDLATGQDLADEVPWVKFTQTVWSPDGQGFFYSRYDAPVAGAALTGANRFQKLAYHRLGTPASADPVVMANPAEPDWRFSAEVLNDRRTLAIEISRNGRKNSLMLLDLPEGAYAPGSTPTPLVMDFAAEHAPLAVVDGQLLLRTDRDAPRGRVVAVDLKQPSPGRWTTRIAETADALVDAHAVGGRLVLRYLHDAASLVRVHAVDGSLQRTLALPGVGTVGGLGGHWDDPETFYSFTSSIHPPELQQLDLASGASTLFKRPATAFDPAQFVMRQDFVTSPDGTRVPVFIAHRQGLKLDGSHPTILYGYGGFGVSMTPGYSVTAATWLRMGGVYVVAALRGGGEYGSAWHDAGTQLRKQNVFDDFIACAQWLIDRGYTRPARLAINGGSNGGLLVGAVLNQRPELFGAAVPQVGVMDMLRYHLFTIGRAWSSDYGTSENEAQFQALRAYSPLHTLRSGPEVRYPPVLVTTADHDDRVVPAHSFKYAAALQAAQTGPAPKLIRIVTNAGHGAGMPTAMLIDERADILSFIANALGLALP